MKALFKLLILWLLKLFYREDDSQDKCDQDFAAWVDSQIRLLQEEIKS